LRTLAGQIVRERIGKQARNQPTQALGILRSVATPSNRPRQDTAFGSNSNSNTARTPAWADGPDSDATQALLSADAQTCQEARTLHAVLHVPRRLVMANQQHDANLASPQQKE
jgi:hypothetical protein